MKTDLTELNNIPREKWGILADKKIYFGHQSVGYNIIDGIKDIMREVPNCKLNIRETKNPLDFGTPVFAHSGIGRNCDPVSKIDDFKKIMDGGVGGKTDVAFFKFCYVDIVEKTEVAPVFDYYVNTLEELQKRYPGVKFIHCTVPLNATPADIATRIKRLLGRPAWTDADNIKRNEFNRMLAGKFGDTVFDLAKFEAAAPGGGEITFRADGKNYLSMNPLFTGDGGHLNLTGRVRIGKELLKMLIKN